MWGALMNLSLVKTAVTQDFFANVHFVDVWYHTEQVWAGRWLNIRPDSTKGSGPSIRVRFLGRT